MSGYTDPVQKRLHADLCSAQERVRKAHESHRPIEERVRAERHLNQVHARMREHKSGLIVCEDK